MKNIIALMSVLFTLIMLTACNGNGTSNTAPINGNGLVYYEVGNTPTSPLTVHFPQSADGLVLTQVDTVYAFPTELQQFNFKITGLPEDKTVLIRANGQVLFFCAFIDD